MKFSESLKKNTDFRRVYNKGSSHSNRMLVMYVLPNNKEENRFRNFSKQKGWQQRSKTPSDTFDSWKLQTAWRNVSIWIGHCSHCQSKRQKCLISPDQECSFTSGKSSFYIKYKRKMKRRWNNFEKYFNCID